jgi:ribosome-associated protein
MTTTAKPSESAAKKDVQKLQRAIVDGLEDVKAQEIAVFNTELLSSLFERVIIASGTSNRQTKALAASVRDAVREAGFPKPRIEGEANGEWIIVDCGAAVAHIMQPAIRTYYNLEEIWGQTPVRLKFGATKPVIAVAETPAVPAKKSAKKASTDGPSLRRSSAVKTAEREAKAIADAAKPPARKSSRPGAKTAPRRAPVRSSTPVSAVSASKSASKTVAKTASTAVAKPASKPVAMPVAKPAVKAAAKPTAKVAAKAPAKVAAKAAAKAAAPAPAKAPAKAAAKAPLKVAAKPAAKAATKAPAKKATR